MENVIFRREYNKYTKRWGFLACFPDDIDYRYFRARIAAIPFHFDQEDRAIFEPYGEISMDYFYSRQIIHKNDPIIPKLVKALVDMYEDEYKVIEKIMRR